MIKLSLCICRWLVFLYNIVDGMEHIKLYDSNIRSYISAENVQLATDNQNAAEVLANITCFVRKYELGEMTCLRVCSCFTRENLRVFSA
jgi:hypothetical protein